MSEWAPKDPGIVTKTGNKQPSINRQERIAVMRDWVPKYPGIVTKTGNKQQATVSWL